MHWVSSLALVPAQGPVRHHGWSAHHRSQLVHDCVWEQASGCQGVVWCTQERSAVGQSRPATPICTVSLARCKDSPLPVLGMSNMLLPCELVQPCSPFSGVGPVRMNMSSTPPVTRQLRAHAQAGSGWSMSGGMRVGLRKNVSSWLQASSCAHHHIRFVHAPHPVPVPYQPHAVCWMQCFTSLAPELVLGGHNIQRIAAEQQHAPSRAVCVRTGPTGF